MGETMLAMLQGHRVGHALITSYGQGKGRPPFCDRDTSRNRGLMQTMWDEELRRSGQARAEQHEVPDRLETEHGSEVLNRARFIRYGGHT